MWRVSEGPKKLWFHTKKGPKRQNMLLMRCVLELFRDFWVAFVVHCVVFVVHCVVFVVHLCCIVLYLCCVCVVFVLHSVAFVLH